MSVGTRRQLRRLTSLQVRTRLQTIVFGDRYGLSLFLLALLFFGTTWRVGFFINDNYTIANTLVNVADGHLAVTHVIYGPDSGATPGMYIHDGQLYGRNYGLVIAALPFLWLFQALSVIADLQIALAALWSLLLVGTAITLGPLTNYDDEFRMGGSLLALVFFVGNVFFATPLETRWLAMVALQTSNMVWASLTGVVCYRLIAALYDRRTGLAAAMALLVATPVGFWAPIPKRHVLISLLALVAIYLFYRSRTTPEQARYTRAAAYACVGLSTWVFPLEGLLLLLALAPIDLLTARSNTPRTLVTIGVVFGLSLLPFLITNVLITGDPLQPPGLLPSYNGQEQILTESPDPTGESGGSTGGGAGSGESASGGSRGETGGGTTDEPAGTPASDTPHPSVGIVTLVVGLWQAALGHIDLLWTMFLSPGIETVRTEPERLFQTFVHSGYIESIAAKDGAAVNLGLLESAPLLATLVAVPLTAAQRLRTSAAIRQWLASPVGQTDLFVATYVTVITLTYIKNLPLHAMVTVRYLLPILPGLVYTCVRLPQVRRPIQTDGRLCLFVYVGSVAIGGQLLFLVLLVQQPGLGEAVQLYAWLALLIAGLVASWTLLATRTNSHNQWGAVSFGLAAGATTVFLLLSAFVYFDYVGQFALPIGQRLSELLPLL